jgi:hypothetical protein
MHGVLERLKKEARKFLVAAVFFAVAFCLIVLANKLKVKGSDIEVISFARAIVGGLIGAKVLITMDLLPFVDAFAGKPLVYNISWKTLIYTAASLAARYIEPLIKSLFAGASWPAAHHHVVQEFTHPAFWSTEIWIALVLLIFVTGQELTRALGTDKVRLLFFGR